MDAAIKFKEPGALKTGLDDLERELSSRRFAMDLPAKSPVETLRAALERLEQADKAVDQLAERMCETRPDNPVKIALFPASPYGDVPAEIEHLASRVTAIADRIAEASYQILTRWTSGPIA